MKIIQAKKVHYEQIVKIYNWAITNTTSTFDTDEKSLSDYEDFLNSFVSHPLIVAVEGDEVIGWGCLKPYSQRKAYDDTVELSIYLDPNHHGKGVGTKVMQELINLANKKKYHTILSRVTVESTASIKLHKKFGFFEVGAMKEVGLKFGRRIDVLLMQKLL